jgi:hypothetical protein
MSKCVLRYPELEVSLEDDLYRREKINNKFYKSQVGSYKVEFDKGRKKITNWKREQRKEQR